MEGTTVDKCNSALGYHRDLYTQGAQHLTIPLRAKSNAIFVLLVYFENKCRLLGLLASLVHFIRVCLLLQFVNSFTSICSFVRTFVYPSVRSISFVRFASLVDGRLVMISSYNICLFSRASAGTQTTHLTSVTTFRKYDCAKLPLFSSIFWL